jgi:hypothetical protein
LLGSVGEHHGDLHALIVQGTAIGQRLIHLII